MSNSPKVVVVNMFTPSFKNLNYKYPTKDKVHSSTMNMFDYYADNKKKAFFMLDYFQGKTYHSNVSKKVWICRYKKYELSICTSYRSR